jgi:chromosome segregation ATPase
MAMESVLKKLESRIEEFVEAHRVATARVAELETRVAELEAEAAGSTDLGDRLKALEGQRDELADRLEQVLGLIDGALDRG